MTLHIFNPEPDIALAANLTNFTAPHALKHAQIFLNSFIGFNTMPYTHINPFQVHFMESMNEEIVVQLFNKLFTALCVECWIFAFPPAIRHVVE